MTSQSTAAGGGRGCELRHCLCKFAVVYLEMPGHLRDLYNVKSKGVRMQCVALTYSKSRTNAFF